MKFDGVTVAVFDAKHQIRNIKEFQSKAEHYDPYAGPKTEEGSAELSFRRAEKRDAEILIGIYDSAFYDDYVKYGECPGYGRTKENMEASIAGLPKTIAYYQNQPVGAISVESKGNGKYYIGALCVKKEFQGRGIGTALMKRFLSEHPDWSELTLETPADKEENIRFYTVRFGFEIVGEKRDGAVTVFLFRLNRQPIRP